MQLLHIVWFLFSVGCPKRQSLLSLLSIFLPSGLSSPPLQCWMIHGWCRLREQCGSSDHWELNSCEQPETLAPGCAVSCYLSAKCQPQPCSLSDEKLKKKGRGNEGEMRAASVTVCQKHLCLLQWNLFHIHSASGATWGHFRTAKPRQHTVRTDTMCTKVD